MSDGGADVKEQRPQQRRFRVHRDDSPKRHDAQDRPSLPGIAAYANGDDEPDTAEDCGRSAGSVGQDRDMERPGGSSRDRERGISQHTHRPDRGRDRPAGRDTERDYGPAGWGRDRDGGRGGSRGLSPRRGYAAGDEERRRRSRSRERDRARDHDRHWQHSRPYNGRDDRARDSRGRAGDRDMWRGRAGDDGDRYREAQRDRGGDRYRGGSRRSRSRGRDDRSRSRSRSRSPKRDSARRSGFDAPPAAPVTASAGMPSAGTGQALYIPPLAADPLETVRRMMGVPVGAQPGAVPSTGVPPTGMTAAQKKALLWGSKKAEATLVKSSVASAVTAVAPTEAAAPAGVMVGQALYGTNRWDSAEFATQAEKAKFLKIMGVKDEVALPIAPAPEEARQLGHTAMTRDVQSKVLGSIEQAFTKGLAQSGRTTGLGS